MEFQVEVVETLGDGVIVHGTVIGHVATAPSGEEDVLPPLPGERAAITTKFDPSTRPTPGDRIHLGVAPAHVHVFDARTGNSIV
jgi:hypothetical protein